jgi:ABC-type nitrate/sulfonate/bicarbonate transport system permease component
MAGFLSAAIVAIPLGLMLGRITTLREFMMPAVQAVYPIPGIAWIPLAILWFGLGDTAVVFVVFATVFFPLLFNAEAGARLISPTVLDAGRCFGARGFSLFFRVVLPATVPYIITGLRISLGGAWRMIVAGEMLASQDGIGYLLMESRFQFRAVELMTAMILVAIVGYATEKLIVGTIEKRTIEKWEVQPS